METLLKLIELERWKGYTSKQTLTSEERFDLDTEAHNSSIDRIIKEVNEYIERQLES